MLFKYTSVVSLLSAALLVNALPSPAVPIAPPAVKKYHFNLDIYTENYETGKHQAIHKVLYNVLGCECWPLDDHTKGHVKSYTFLSKDRDLHIAFYSDDKCFGKRLPEKHDGSVTRGTIPGSPIKAEGVKVCLPDHGY